MISLTTIKFRARAGEGVKNYCPYNGEIPCTPSCTFRRGSFINPDSYIVLCVKEQRNIFEEMNS